MEQELYARGSYLMVCREMVRLVGIRNLAIFLSDLINHAKNPAVYKDKDDWFLCTTEFLMESMDWDRNMQTRYLQMLKRMGYVEVSVIGMPKKRHLRLDIQKIRRDLSYYMDDPDEGGTETQKKHDSKRVEHDSPCTKRRLKMSPMTHQEESLKKTKDKDKKKTLSHRDSSAASPPLLSRFDGVSFFGLDEVEQQNQQSKNEHENKHISNPENEAQSRRKKWTEELMERLEEKNLIMRKPNKQSWMLEFEKLERKRDPEQIERILQWYIRNIQKPYIPHIYSAQSFFERFAQLENARKIQKQKRSKAIGD